MSHTNKESNVTPNSGQRTLAIELPIRGNSSHVMSQHGVDGRMTYSTHHHLNARDDSTGCFTVHEDQENNHDDGTDAPSQSNHGQSCKEQVAVPQDGLGSIAQEVVCLVEGETMFETPRARGSRSAAIVLGGLSPGVPPAAPRKKFKGFRDVYSETLSGHHGSELTPSHHGAKGEDTWQDVSPFVPLAFCPKMDRFDPFKLDMSPNFLK